MVRLALLSFLLSSCSANVTPPQFTFHCPPAPPIPPEFPHKTLQVRTEVAREAEHNRGDACAAANEERDIWIQNMLNPRGH